MNSPPFQSKRKKKQEVKPQSHINKCLNEKLRRKQENTYFEELAKLIQASFIADMHSLSSKPDKGFILQQTVDKINQIREEREAKVSNEAVQQGEVTSSRQTLLQDNLVCPLVLQALDGFLFLVNTDSKIELVSENVNQYIKFTPEDLVGESILNFIHVGDLNKFTSAFGSSVDWSKLKKSSSQSFNCRILVKSPEDQETMEEKQQRVSQYEQMQVCTVLNSGEQGERKESEESSDCVDQQYLLCIARRIATTEPSGNVVEQFTTKLDIRGNILDIDTSGISSSYSPYLNKELVHQNFGDLCYPSDLNSFSANLKDTTTSGHSKSSVYKLQLGPSLINIQSKFKQFKNHHEDPYIMATHSILSSFQEGSGSTSGILDDLSMSRGADDRTRTESKHRLPMQNEGQTDINRNMEAMTGLESQSQTQQNKILKRLLDQEDNDDQSMTLSFPKGLNRIRKTPSPNHTHFIDPNSGNANNMLRNLLNDQSSENDDMKIKDESEDILDDILNGKDDKFIKREFQPSTPGTPSNYFMSSPPGTPGMSMQSYSFVSASPISDSGDHMKGIKRRNESPHDGNPSKQAPGGFEKLLEPSPPVPNSKSPSISMSGGTPIASPNTPRSATPLNNLGQQIRQPTYMTHHMMQEDMHMQVNQFQNRQNEDSTNNRLLRELLSSQSSKVSKQGLPPLREMPSPFALPKEKLPKDLGEKLPRVSNATSVATHSSTVTPSAEILTKLLKQPVIARGTCKSHSVLGSFTPTSQQSFYGDNMQRQNSGVTSDNLEMPETSRPPTSLPPFVPPSGIQPLNVPSSGYTEGQLPSIVSGNPYFSQDHLNHDLHASAIEAILALESDAGTSDYSSSLSATTDYQNAILQIKNELMSIDKEKAVSTPSNYMEQQNMNNMSFPPPYKRFIPVPVGSNQVHAQHIQNRPQVHQQRRMGSIVQDGIRPRLQRNPSLINNNSSEVNQQSPAYHQGFEELITNTPNNPNIMQRNHTENQTSPNYNMLNSPMSGCTDQVSPAQRISQGPFSPHGPISSPLSNPQQFQNNSNMGQLGYTNVPNSQQSTVIAQGSPDPPYSGGGLPQISPTGQVAQSPQSPVWNSANQRSIQQSMHSPQLNMMSQGPQRGYSQRTGTMLPSVRSIPNNGTRSSYPQGHQADTFQGGGPTNQIIYSQTNPPYRIQRTMSTPQMQGVHSPRSAHYTIQHPGHLQQPPSNAPSHFMNPYPQNSLMNHSMMSSPMGPMDNPQMMGHMGSGVGGMIGGFGEAGVPSHNYDVGSPNCFTNTETARNSPGNQGHLNNQTRRQLLARVTPNNCGPDGNGPNSPMGQPIHRVTQQPGRPQNPNNFQPPLEHSRSVDPTLMQNYDNWNQEPVSAPSHTQAASLAPSPRLEEIRSSNTPSDADRSSLLKSLLISNTSNPMI